MRWASTNALIGAVGLLAVLGNARPVSAQGKGPGVELGYQYQVHSDSENSETFPAGFGATATYPLKHDIEVLGQFDWSRTSESDSDRDVVTVSTVFGGGIRWNYRRPGDLNPFVQGLFGVMKEDFDLVSKCGCGESHVTNTDPLLQVGGGVMGKLNAKWHWVGQVDYRRVITDYEAFNATRVFLGVRLGLR
jgi:hypothetical protein